MTGPLPLPVPYIPGLPGSGLGDQKEFADNVQQNLDAIASAVGSSPVVHVGDTAGGDLSGTYPNPSVVKIRGKAVAAINWGSDTVVFSASDSSAQLTVAHGLGVTPLNVQLTARSPANARVTIQETASPDSTNFYVKGFQTEGSSISVSQTFYWLAIA